MIGMKFNECGMDFFEIFETERSANIDVASDKADSVKHCCISADEHKLNFVADESLKKLLKMRHVLD